MRCARAPATPSPDGPTSILKEGVRYRAVVQKIKDSSMGFFDKVMNEDDITVTDVDGAPVAGFGEPGQTLVITLDCTWPLLTPLVSPFFPEGDYKFTVGATMRNEAFPGV